MSDGAVTGCVRGHRKYIGRHPITGEKLHWKYYSDYINEFGESTEIKFFSA